MESLWLEKKEEGTGNTEIWEKACCVRNVQSHVHLNLFSCAGLKPSAPGTKTAKHAGYCNLQAAFKHTNIISLAKMHLFWIYGEELFSTCGILTDGFSAGFWKHMQYFKQFRTFISQRLSKETLHSGDAVLHPDYASTSLQADTHVSIVDVEHVNLCWRFNFLDASSVPTERQRRKCQFHSLIRGERSSAVHPQALDKLL